MYSWPQGSLHTQRHAEAKYNHSHAEIWRLARHGSQKISRRFSDMWVALTLHLHSSRKHKVTLESLSVIVAAS